jgi:uncharacterized protein YnzC (UPF0291/DUF896 family)
VTIVEFQALIVRLNELYRKSKSGGLSPAELTERDALRREYLGSIRNQVQNSLGQIKIVDEQGNEVTPQRRRHHHGHECECHQCNCDGSHHHEH